MIRDKLIGKLPAVSGDVPEGVSFDGVSDYLSRDSNLEGITDTNTFTMSLWMYLPGDALYLVREILAVSGRCYLQINDEDLQFSFKDTNNNYVFRSKTFLNTPFRDTWTHIIISREGVDSYCIYINDELQDIDVVDDSSNNMDFTTDTVTVMKTAGSNDICEKARLSEVFFDTTYRDLSIEANRRLFITADGKPAKGLEKLNPILYLPMKDKATAHINLGTGGDFVQNGLIETADRGANQDNCVMSEFDGSDDSLHIVPTYPTDTNKLIISFDIQFHSFDSSDNFVISLYNYTSPNSTYYVALYYNGNYEYVEFLVSDDTNNSCVIYRFNMDEIILYKNYNIQITFDSINNLKQVVINGIMQTKAFYKFEINKNIPLNTKVNRTMIGASGYDDTGNKYFKGSIGELYFDTNYIDLSQNNPFWNSDTNKPVPVRKVMQNLGTNPLICMSISPSNPTKNYGSGGDFTLNGGPLKGARGMSEYIARSIETKEAETDLTINNLNVLVKTSPVFSSDGKTLSLFIITNGNHSTSYPLVIRSGLSDTILDAALRIQIEENTSNWSIISDDIDLSLSGTHNSSGKPKIIFISLDMDNENKTIVYINELLDVTINNFATGSLLKLNSYDNTSPMYDCVGLLRTTNSNKFYNTYGVYLTTDYIDFSQEANRNLFVNQLGYPRDLKPLIEDGTIPEPLIYLPFDDPDNLGKNLGTGGNFTINGTVTPGPDFSL